MSTSPKPSGSPNMNQDLSEELNKLLNESTDDKEHATYFRDEQGSNKSADERHRQLENELLTPLQDQLLKLEDPMEDSLKKS